MSAAAARGEMASNPMSPLVLAHERQAPSGLFGASLKGVAERIAGRRL
jgi:hypothetical protein